MVTAFSATTRLPFAALTTSVAPLSRRYGVKLDAAQQAMLEFYATLYPFQKYGAIRSALDAGRFYLAGSDLLALTRKRTDIDEPSTELS